MAKKITFASASIGSPSGTVTFFTDVNVRKATGDVGDEFAASEKTGKTKAGNNYVKDGTAVVKYEEDGTEKTAVLVHLPVKSGWAVLSLDNGKKVQAYAAFDPEGAEQWKALEAATKPSGGGSSAPPPKPQFEIPPPDPASAGVSPVLLAAGAAAAVLFVVNK